MIAVIAGALTVGIAATILACCACVIAGEADRAEQREDA